MAESKEICVMTIPPDRKHIIRLSPDLPFKSLSIELNCEKHGLNKNTGNMIISLVLYIIKFKVVSYISLHSNCSNVFFFKVDIS